MMINLFFSCSALPATDVPGQPDEQHANCSCSQHQRSPGLLHRQPLWHQHPRCQLHPWDPGHHRRRRGHWRREWQQHIRYNFTRLSHISLNTFRPVFSGLFNPHYTLHSVWWPRRTLCVSAIIWEIFSFDLALVYSSIPWLSPIFPGVLALVWSAILGKSAAPYTQPVQGGNILQLFHPGIL